MNVYKIEVFFADEYSDNDLNFLDGIQDQLLDYCNDGEKTFVKIISCVKQDIDIESILFENFDESKAVNILVK